MSFPAFAWSVRFFLLAVLVVFTAAVLMIDPNEASWAIPSFFIIWYLLWSSLAAWGLLELYRYAIGEERTLKYRQRLFEQSALIGGGIILITLFRYFRVLEWWVGGLVLVGVLLLELTLRRQSHIS